MAEGSHLKPGFPFPDKLFLQPFFLSLFLSLSLCFVCFHSSCMEANDSIYSHNTVAKPPMFLFLLVVFLLLQIHLRGSSYLMSHVILSHFQNENVPFECILCVVPKLQEYCI